MKSFCEARVRGYENRSPWLPSFIPCGEKRFFFTRFCKIKFDQEKCWSSGKKYSCYKNFLSELFDSASYLFSEQKAFVNSGDILLDPGPAENPILLAYGRRFMCLSSTYVFFK